MAGNKKAILTEKEIVKIFNRIRGVTYIKKGASTLNIIKAIIEDSDDIVVSQKKPVPCAARTSSIDSSKGNLINTGLTIKLGVNKSDALKDMCLMDEFDIFIYTPVPLSETSNNSEAATLNIDEHYCHFVLLHNSVYSPDYSYLASVSYDTLVVVSNSAVLNCRLNSDGVAVYNETSSSSGNKVYISYQGCELSNLDLERKVSELPTIMVGRRREHFNLLGGFSDGINKQPIPGNDLVESRYFQNFSAIVSSDVKEELIGLKSYALHLFKSGVQLYEFYDSNNLTDPICIGDIDSIIDKYTYSTNKRVFIMLVKSALIKTGFELPSIKFSIINLSNSIIINCSIINRNTLVMQSFEFNNVYMRASCLGKVSRMHSVYMIDTSYLTANAEYLQNCILISSIVCSSDLTDVRSTGLCDVILNHYGTFKENNFIIKYHDHAESNNINDASISSTVSLVLDRDTALSTKKYGNSIEDGVTFMFSVLPSESVVNLIRYHTVTEKVIAVVCKLDNKFIDIEWLRAADNRIYLLSKL